MNKQTVINEDKDEKINTIKYKEKQDNNFFLLFLLFPVVLIIFFLISLILYL